MGQYSPAISHLEEDEDEEELVDNGDTEPESPVGCQREAVMVRLEEAQSIYFYFRSVPMWLLHSCSQTVESYLGGVG